MTVYSKEHYKLFNHRLLYFHTVYICGLIVLKLLVISSLKLYCGHCSTSKKHVDPKSSARPLPNHVIVRVLTIRDSSCEKHMWRTTCEHTRYSGGATPGRARSNDMAGRPTALAAPWLKNSRVKNQNSLACVFKCM